MAERKVVADFPARAPMMIAAAAVVVAGGAKVAAAATVARPRRRLNRAGTTIFRSRSGYERGSRKRQAVMFGASVPECARRVES